MYFTSTVFKRLDLDANLKKAIVVSNIPFQTLDDGYKRLRGYFDKNYLLHEVQTYNKTEGKDKKDQKEKSREGIDTAFSELESMVNSFCDIMLGENNHKKAHLTYLAKLRTEIHKAQLSYGEIFSAYQNLIAKIALLVNERKVNIINNNINNTQETTITEIKKSRCVII